MGQAAGGAGQGSPEVFGALLGELEASVAAACLTQEEWPARVAAGIYAGVDYAIDHPTVVDALHAVQGAGTEPYRRLHTHRRAPGGACLTRRAGWLSPARQHR